MSPANVRRNCLSATLVIMLLGMSASITIDSDERKELPAEEIVIETHSNSNINHPGFHDGSIYTATSLTASTGHTCVILHDQSMKCWGDAGQGFLGNSYIWTEFWTPDEVHLGDQGGANTAKETASFGHHSCTIMTDNAVKCWGEAAHGQLGHGVHSGWHASPFLAVMGANVTPIEMAAGFHHTCSIYDDYNLYCWGDNFWGQVGNNGTLGGANEDVGYPTLIPLPQNRTAIAVNLGGDSSCTILDNGSGMCWGLNDHGQLGDGTMADKNAPTPITVIPSNRTLAAIAVGVNNTCGLLDDGSVYCWGNNSYGQHGDGTNSDSNLTATTGAYASLPSGRTAISIDMGKEHVCAILDDNSVACWGDNTYGQLGDNTTNSSNIPIVVNGNHSFQAISTGYHLSLIHI